jgi:hypothetical protein
MSGQDEDDRVFDLTGRRLAYHHARGLPLHTAYTTWGTTRVSCAFCILGSHPDLLASSRNPDHLALYREMVALEVCSTFAFQDSQWLSDVNPALLTPEQRDGLVLAKDRALLREAAESRIPKHLLYEDGWPNVMPSHGEAELLAGVRRQVAEIVQLDIKYTDAEAVYRRFGELIELKAIRAAKTRRAA